MLDDMTYDMIYLEQYVLCAIRFYAEGLFYIIFICILLYIIL